MSAQETVMSVESPAFYDHFRLLMDGTRMLGFQDVFDKLILPRAKVVDLAGGAGELSFYAAKKASKIWCLEIDPSMAAAANRLMELNGIRDRVEVIGKKVEDFLPPEPVDVVICEMTGVGLLREPLVVLLNSFRRRYAEKFKDSSPLYIPHSTVQAVQPLQFSFNFHGYFAPVPVFQKPDQVPLDGVSLGNPETYQVIEYAEPLPENCVWEGEMEMTASGTFNALRFVTKNVIGLIEAESRVVEWFHPFMVLPLKNPLLVSFGEKIKIAFEYVLGGPIGALEDSIRVSK